MPDFPLLLLAFAALHAVFWLILLSNIVYFFARQQPQHRTVPLLSIIVPARNEEANLPRLLDSLLAQRDVAMEVLVYDDHSEDGTWDVLQRYAAKDKRIRPLNGPPLPSGWMGKNHALFQATRHATGSHYLFLDADVAYQDDGALARFVEKACAYSNGHAITVMPRFKGGGLVLVSMVINVFLIGLPWLLVRRLRMPALGALNGQCWMIYAPHYHQHEPHRTLKAEILEDVMIGRFLKSQGITPVMLNGSRILDVYMYDSFADARLGFQKNAYLLLGGHWASFVFLHVGFVLTFLAPLFVHWGFWASLFALKLVTDRVGRLPAWVTLLAPLSYMLAAFIQLDSARFHWRGEVTWKGRTVSGIDESAAA
ncbi:MAG: glycosyltransferase family 2 protein [Bacteroidota bacterium]